MANQLKTTIYKIVDKKYYIGYNKVLLITDCLQGKGGGSYGIYGAIS